MRGEGNEKRLRNYRRIDEGRKEGRKEEKV